MFLTIIYVNMQYNSLLSFCTCKICNQVFLFWYQLHIRKQFQIPVFSFSQNLKVNRIYHIWTWLSNSNLDKVRPLSKQKTVEQQICFDPRVVRHDCVWLLLLAVRSEEHILQCMCGTIGGGDEAKKKEDEVGHTKQLSQLFVDDLFSERHLLLRVPSEPIPSNDLLHNGRD